LVNTISGSNLDLGTQKAHCAWNGVLLSVIGRVYFSRLQNVARSGPGERRSRSFDVLQDRW
jgi:hypothetical protein